MKVEFVKGGVFDNAGNKYLVGDTADLDDAEAEDMRDKGLVKRATSTKPAPKTTFKPVEKSDEKKAAS